MENFERANRHLNCVKHKMGKICGEIVHNDQWSSSSAQAGGREVFKTTQLASINYCPCNDSAISLLAINTITTTVIIVSYYMNLYLLKCSESPLTGRHRSGLHIAFISD